MKILIAEDDLVSRTFLNKFMAKYGECDLVVDGLETIDAFLMALKEEKPYDLICLDIMMPKVDGIKTLKAIRALEKQYGVEQENGVKIIMTTALAEAQIVRMAFEYGCEAYASKPVDTKKLIEVMQKLKLISASSEGGVDDSSLIVSNYNEENKNTSEQSSQKRDLSHKINDKAEQIQDGYFKSVHALPDYQLEIVMETGTTIHFDFRPRLNTVRFGMLRNEELFRSVCTDGNYLIFRKADRMPVKITASEFMDLVLIDRRK